MPVAPKISPGGIFQGHFGGQNTFNTFILQAEALVRLGGPLAVIRDRISRVTAVRAKHKKRLQQNHAFKLA